MPAGHKPHPGPEPDLAVGPAAAIARRLTGRLDPPKARRRRADAFSAPV
jgi:hypothetical protein